MKAKVLSIALMILFVGSLNSWSNETIEASNNIELTKYEYNGLITAYVLGLPVFVPNQTVKAEIDNGIADLVIENLSILSYNFGSIEINGIPIDGSGNLTPTTTTVVVPGLGTYVAVLNGTYATASACSLNLVIQGTPSGNITVTYAGAAK